MAHTTDPLHAPRAAKGWSLVTHGDGEVLPLRSLPCRIGRQPGLPVRVIHPTVSLVHAELRLEGETLMLVDLNSRNGTYVNGQRIVAPQAVVLGDLVQFGAAVFRLNNEQRTCLAATSCSEDMGDLALAIAQFDKLIDEQVVTPHFQPIVDATTGETIAYEALARSRLYGLDNPAIMFKAAEFFQKEAQLSRMLRVEALRRGAPHAPPQLFLNTHPAELSELKPLLLSLEDLRRDYPDFPLTLEVHEACAVDAATIKMLRLVLDDLGMKLAYDDFGAGQARLQELIDARPDYLKFDRKLIANLDAADPDRLQLVESLVVLARQLKISTLAEGIETAGEAEACRRLGFELFQGYFFGRPQAHPTVSAVPAHVEDRPRKRGDTTVTMPTQH